MPSSANGELSSSYNNQNGKRPPDEEHAIAIVGMACRLPQEADNPEKLWELLLHGRSAMTEFPAHKFNIDAHYHPDPAHGGSMSCRHGHFLKDSGHHFDAPFFNITKTEALSMDPQQRLLMENVYEALENAGISVDSVTGTETSVFVGAFTNDFQSIANLDPEMPLKYGPTGNSNSILSNRVSWFYDLKGCSLTLDTACSSSLVAVHLAYRSIIDGNARMAIVGGVNVIEYPPTLYGMSNLGFLSPDGKCYSFDHRANGYSRGEGVGVVILKPLKKALEDGDTIRAVIRSTGVNQDGRTPGMTLPSKAAQEKLIRSVYDSAGLDLTTTGFVEAHGTGTPRGDPVEAAAIAAAWNDRKSETPLYIGAIKSNVGHLEGTSGVAGLIKTIQVLEKAIIPPNINFEKVNAKILPEKWNIEFPSQPIPWPNNSIRRASVNSFGFGGTNAHVVVDDAYNFLRLRQLQGAHRSVACSPKLADLRPQELGDSKTVNGHDNSEEADSNGIEFPVDLGPNNLGPQAPSIGRVFVFSSFDEDGIKRIAQAYTEHFSSNPKSDESRYLNDLAYTLAEKRTMFSWKGFAVASSLAELARRLPDSVKTSQHTPKGNTFKLGFVFTGQGAQWNAMGRDLLVYPVFRNSLEAAGKYIQELGGPWRLLDELSKSPEGSNINHPTLSQTTCTALQVALVDLLASWGIFPSRVVGHSSGEIAAAYSAGAITRELAWKIAYYRGVVSAKLAMFHGAMMAVGIDLENLQTYLGIVNAEVDGELTVACFNSPRNITVSGDEKKIDRLGKLLEESKIFFKKLNVRNAYHSGHMKAVAEEYLQLIGDISISTTLDSERSYSNKVTMFSSVSGLEVSPTELRTAQYWVSNMTLPVKFDQSLLAMCSSMSGEKLRLRVGRSADIPLHHLVEIGPHPALKTAIRDTLSTDQTLSLIGYSHLVGRNGSAKDFSLETVGRLFCSGYPVDLFAVNHSGRYPRPKMLVDLPPYRFNHSQIYWPEGRLGKNFRFRKFPRHDLLGAPVPDWSSQDPKWRHMIRISENPWLKDHKVTGRIVYPGVGYIVMALEAARQLAEVDDAKIIGFQLRDISIKSALQVPEIDSGIETVLSMPRATESSLSDSSIWRRFKLLSYNPSSDDWTEHCTGLIKVELESKVSPVDAGREAAAEAGVLKANLEECVRKCISSFDMARSYTELEAIGLSFGPLFRNLTNVLTGSGIGEAIGQVCVPDICASMPKKFTHPHIIHPATMDSMLHVFLAAVQDSIGGTRLSEAMVPVFIRDVWVSREINSKPGTLFQTHGTVRKSSQNKIKGSITAWETGNEAPKVVFRGIQFVSIQSSSATHRKRHMNFNIEWKPDIDLYSQRQCEAQLQGQITPLTSDLAAVHKMAEGFNLAALIYITDALKIVGNDKMDDKPEHLQKYLTWMRYQEERSRQGLILHQTPAWKMVMNSSMLKEKLLKELEKTGPEGKLTVRMGSNIVSVMRQEVDPLQLMFGDNLLDSYYSKVAGTEKIHELLKSYLEIYGHKYAGLKILEIGAGTGGTTLCVLEALCPWDNSSRLAKYTYTDISPGFFEKAKAKFKSWLHALEFQRLDIEMDPLSQGFEAAHYDIVIASNVLHATRNIENTLQNVRSLLRPGGKLLLQEAVNPSLLSGPLAFGTLPGWWLGVEESRKLWPLLNEDQWNEVLLKTGFSGTDITLKDDLNEEIHAQSLMISTIPNHSSSAMLSDETAVVLLSSDILSPLALELEIALRGSGLPITQAKNFQDLEMLNFKHSICIVLRELENAIFPEIDEATFQIMRRQLSTCAGLLWVTKDPAGNPEVSLSTGLIRSVRWERDLEDSNLVLLALESTNQPLETMASQIAKLFEYQFLQRNTTQRNAEYKMSGDTILINRLVNASYLDEFLLLKVGKPAATPQPFRADQTRALKLITDSPGLLNSLQFVDCPVFESDLQPHDVEVEIRATGLNFRDVMSAMGEVDGDTLGAEGAGIIRRVGAKVTNVKVDDRVVLLASRTGCFQSFARTIDAAVAQIPPELSFKKAAGIPVTACTAYYCLVDLARLSKGESILIHAAAGGVGQAAVMLAQHMGAEIFATVSTEEKKDILTKTYNIPEDHIFSSRDLLFAKGVMRLTQDKGVNVILNSLAGEALRLSWSCIAPFGRFIEIGKRDIYANTRLEMFPFSRNVTFASCDLETVMRLDHETTSRLLHETMDLWRRGVLKETTPLNVFPYSQIEASFRLLQSGKHIGKIVLVADKDHNVPVVPKTLPEYYFPENATYVLSGGFGGLGRSMARWMVRQGARHLIILSRKGATTEAAREILKELSGNGCEVAAFACDVANIRSLQEVISKCSTTMPPVKGCIQGAMQLKDSAFETMSFEDFQCAIAPKVQGSWNLHQVLPRDMDFFIMISSICGIIGNRGQSNYAAGNTYQDALAHYRVRNGLHAASIDLGTMLSVGFIAEHKGTVNPYAVAVEPIYENEFHAILEYYINSQNPLRTASGCQVAVGLSTRAAYAQKGIPEPSFIRYPLFTMLQSASDISFSDSEEETFAATRALLRAAKTLDEATLIIIETLVKRISSVMSILAEDIDTGKPIHYYGVDSLVAVELRNWLAKNMDAEIEVLDIMGDDSMIQLSEKIAKASKIISIQSD